jgi:hypothetical protein
MVLAGRAGGRLEGNRHLLNPDSTNMSNLMVAVLEKLGIEQNSFGDSTAHMTL